MRGAPYSEQENVVLEDIIYWFRDNKGQLVESRFQIWLECGLGRLFNNRSAASLAQRCRRLIYDQWECEKLMGK